MMINKKFILALGFLIQSVMGLSQDIPKTILYKPNTIYIELLGNTFVLFDIAYDRILYKKNRLGFTASFGAQYLPTGDNSWDKPITSITTGINMIIGRTNYFETGIGFTHFNWGNFKF